MSKFIHLRLGSYIIHHGYDEYNQPIEESNPVKDFTDKVVALDRVLSISDQYILISSAYDRVIY